MTDPDRPLVTAIITTYDRPERVRRAVESALSQTYEPLEVLVVEDGTDSGVKDWLDEQGYEDVTYVRHETNRGLAAARNTGLEHATGEYVAYLDDDDVWKPTRVERQIAALKEVPPPDRSSVGVIYCSVERRRPNGRTMSIGRPVNVGNLAEAIREDGAQTYPSTCLFPREVLVDIGGYDTSLASSIDHDIWMALATNGYHAVAVDEPLVITYVDGRRSMVTDTDARIDGVGQFVEKWSPTYREWFGPVEGRRYAERYFADVVSLLAAQNLLGGAPGEFLTAVRALFGCSSEYRYNAYVLCRTVAVRVAVTVLPPRLLE